MDDIGNNTFTHRVWTNEYNGAFAGTIPLELTIVSALGTPQRNVFLMGSFTQLNVEGRMTNRDGVQGNGEVFSDNLRITFSIPEPSTLALMLLGGLVYWKLRREG